MGDEEDWMIGGRVSEGRGSRVAMTDTNYGFCNLRRAANRKTWQRHRKDVPQDTPHCHSRCHFAVLRTIPAASWSGQAAGMKSLPGCTVVHVGKNK